MNKVGRLRNPVEDFGLFPELETDAVTTVLLAHSSSEKSKWIFGYLNYKFKKTIFLRNWVKWGVNSHFGATHDSPGIKLGQDRSLGKGEKTNLNTESSEIEHKTISIRIRRRIRFRKFSTFQFSIEWLRNLPKSSSSSSSTRKSSTGRHPHTQDPGGQRHLDLEQDLESNQGSSLDQDAEETHFQLSAVGSVGNPPKNRKQKKENGSGRRKMSF